MKWIDVEDKLPEDLWKEKLKDISGWNVESLIDDFIVVVKTNNPVDDPEVTIADYTIDKGWMYCMDNTWKYDGNPWTVTHWMEKPEPPIKIK